jgi:hypothetical protein
VIYRWNRHQLPALCLVAKRPSPWPEQQEPGPTQAPWPDHSTELSPIDPTKVALYLAPRLDSYSERYHVEGMPRWKARSLGVEPVEGGFSFKLEAQISDPDGWSQCKCDVEVRSRDRYHLRETEKKGLLGNGYCQPWSSAVEAVTDKMLVETLGQYGVEYSPPRRSNFWVGVFISVRQPIVRDMMDCLRTIRSDYLRNPAMKQYHPLRFDLCNVRRSDHKRTMGWILFDVSDCYL